MISKNGNECIHIGKTQGILIGQDYCGIVIYLVRANANY